MQILLYTIFVFFKLCSSTFAMGALFFLVGMRENYALNTKFYINSTVVLVHGFSIFSQQTYSYSLSVQFARRKTTRDHVPLPPCHMQPLVSSHQQGPLRQGKQMHCCTAQVPQDMSYKALDATRSISKELRTLTCKEPGTPFPIFHAPRLNASSS
jgi:hypothetical protein